MRWTAPLSILLGAFILLMALVVGCGSDENPSTLKSSDPSMGGQHGQLKILRGDGGRVKEKNACGSALIRLGSKSGDIEFIVHCSGRKKGGVAFVIQSVLFEDKIQFSNYTRMPSVRGAGAVSRYGECSMEQGFISCNATIDGPAAISGSFGVKGDRCASPISIVGITTPACRSNNCFGDPLLDGLFRGRPRGCA